MSSSTLCSFHWSNFLKWNFFTPPPTKAGGWGSSQHLMASCFEKLPAGKQALHHQIPLGQEPTEDGSGHQEWAPKLIQALELNLISQRFPVLGGCVGALWSGQDCISSVRPSRDRNIPGTGPGPHDQVGTAKVSAGWTEKVCVTWLFPGLADLCEQTRSPQQDSSKFPSSCPYYPIRTCYFHDSCRQLTWAH